MRVSATPGRMKNEKCECHVGVCVCVCAQAVDPSLCHSIHPVISNYSEPQVFATASPGLLDLICSTLSINQPLTH